MTEIAFSAAIRLAGKTATGGAETRARRIAKAVATLSS